MGDDTGLSGTVFNSDVKGFSESTKLIKLSYSNPFQPDILQFIANREMGPDDYSESQADQTVARQLLFILNLIFLSL